MGCIPVLHVVLMVARHKDDGAGPGRKLRQWGKALQSKVFALQQAALLIGADIAGQHQNVGIRCGRSLVVGVDFQVQVREQLNFHSIKGLAQNEFSCMHAFGAGFLESLPFEISLASGGVSLYMMRTRVNVRASSWMLLVGLCVAYILAAGLPAAWGSPSGPLAGLQIVTLLLGLLLALVAAYQQRAMAVGKVWLVVAIGWLALLCQELVWPAAWQPRWDGMPAAYGQGAWMSATLWALGVVASAYWVLRYRLISRVVLRWLRESAMPWGCAAVAVLAWGLSTWALGQWGAVLSPVPADSGRVMAAMAQCWAYMALWWGQWLLVHHMQEWRSSSYLQTLHFSRTSLGERFERRSI